MNEATDLLSAMLRQSRASLSKKKKKTSREEEELFEERPGQRFPPGLVNFSPSWFPRGHGVRHILSYLSKVTLTLQRGTLEARTT